LPPPVITYFRSEEDLHADRNGSSEPPVEVGDYYVRIRRPAGNGYKAGNDITVEYHIQKALVTIFYNGDTHHMGASKRVELIIR